VAVRKSVRFEVFKRDGFRCRYCGSGPMGEPLTIDHVLPKSKGGGDGAANLVTACWSCNSGKSNTLLSETKLAKAIPAKALKEQARQLRAMLAAQQEVQEARDDIAEWYADLWRTHVGDDPPKSLYRQFNAIAARYPMAWSVQAMEAVSIRDIRDAIDQAKYFYGCIRKMRAKEELESGRAY